MTPDRKEHWTVKAFRLGSAGALLLSQAGCLPRGQKNPDTSPPPTTSSEITPAITPPVSIEPMIAETLVPGETLAPTETVSLPVWSAPTLEQMLVEGRGGVLNTEIAQYKFEEVIPNGLARIGIEGAVVNFSDNGAAGDAYHWAPLTVNSEGLVIWAYDPAIGQLEWPVELDFVSDAEGKPVYSLHTRGLEYKTIRDSKGAVIVWGGTQDGKYGKYLAILAKDPVTLPDGRQIYSSYWDRTAQAWLSTPGLAEITPEAPLPQEFLDKLPEGYKVTNGQLLNESGVALGTIKMAQSGEGYNLAFIVPDVSGTLHNYEADLSAFVTHPSGALLIDRGERTGFVWKGDKWAEILLDIEFQTNGTELNNLPEVILEDITSGRLAETERLASQPFPEGVEPLNNYYYDSNFNSVYPNFDPQTGYEFSLHPEEFPMRFVYFYQAEINNIPVVVATLQVLNRDGTSIFIHMVESRKFINSYPDYWNKVIRLQRRPTFDMALGGDKYDICGKGGWSKAVTEVACPLNAPKKDELQIAMQRLIEEQSIPEEFEQVLFVLSSGRW